MSILDKWVSWQENEIRGLLLWHSEWSNCLHHWHLLRALAPVSAALLPAQRPQNIPGRQEKLTQALEPVTQGGGSDKGHSVSLCLSNKDIFRRKERNKTSIRSVTSLGLHGILPGLLSFFFPLLYFKLYSLSQPWNVENILDFWL